MTVTEKTPFESVTRTLNLSPTHSHYAWWHKAGSMLAKVLASANYAEEEQHQYLLFFSQNLMSRMGPYPQEFRSSITRSGLPLEFSINYQQNGKRPVVRIGFEPLSSLSGTHQDPFNRNSPVELVSALSELRSGEFDLQLWHEAVGAYTVNDAEQASLQHTEVESAYVRTQIAFGFDLIGNGKISVKGYTFPALKCKVTGKPMAQVMGESVKRMQPLVDCSKAFSIVNAYLEETSYDERSFFSWDFVHPSDSRLKLYTSSATITWDKLEELWTLGGRITGSTVVKGLGYLKQFWDLMKVKEGERTIEVEFDDRQTSSKTTPLVWNYEMRANNPNPLAKVYFPVHGENDMQVITAVADFFRMIGLVELGNSYVDTVKLYYPEVDLSTTERFVSWVSFAYTEKTGVYLSTYYHSSTDNPWKEKEEE